MRSTLVFLFFIVLLGPRAAEARCASAVLTVWPGPSERLPANGRIELEGYGTEQDFIRSLPGRNPRLVSGQRSIPLTVAEVQEGAFRVTQAVLVPASPLEPGRRYVLSVDGRARIPVWYDGNQGPAAWTADAPDTAAPTWGGAPAVRPSTYAPLGCGPAIFGHVAVRISDSSSVRVRVSLAPAAGGAARVYDVSPSEGDLAIGHGMCSGPFELEPGVSYRATLVAVDVSGNGTPAPGSPVTIVGPTP